MNPQSIVHILVTLPILIIYMLHPSGEGVLRGIGQHPHGQDLRTTLIIIMHMDEAQIVWQYR